MLFLRAGIPKQARKQKTNNNKTAHCGSATFSYLQTISWSEFKLTFMIVTYATANRGSLCCGKWWNAFVCFSGILINNKIFCSLKFSSLCLFLSPSVCLSLSLLVVIVAYMNMSDILLPSVYMFNKTCQYNWVTFSLYSCVRLAQWTRTFCMDVFILHAYIFSQSFLLHIYGYKRCTFLFFI